jgi:hypothetical protein
MIDLRTKLRADHYMYRVTQHDSCTMIQPREQYVNREVPVQELVASTFLRTDRYSVSWRMSCSNKNQLQRCEILVFLDDLTKPSLMYDVRFYPEYSVTFQLKRSQYVYVVLRVQGKTPVTLHSLHFMLARDVLVGHDPLMYEWDMQKVALALKQQRLIRGSLTQMHIFFEWDTVLKEVQALGALWRDVFADDAPVDGRHPNSVLQCALQPPQLLATSQQSLVGAFECDPHGEWTLNLQGTKVAHTYVHAQYFIWCFPDKQVKLSLRRDTPAVPNRIEFALEGNDQRKTPIWHWLGYNFIGNSPFYNIWSIIANKLEFINREDLLSMFELIEEHFEAHELQPETNLYK